MASDPQARKKKAGSTEGDIAHSRFVGTVQRLRAEAARTLTREPLPRKREPARPVKGPAPPCLVDGLNESERALLVEVTDDSDNTLVCMPPEAALGQRLRLRLVAVAPRTRQNKIILHRRGDARLGSAGTWDLYTGFVLAGEAREDAAIRLLETTAVIGGLRMTHIADRQAGHVHLALFVTDLPAGVYPARPARELLETDADELRGLVRDAPELFSPELLWAEGTGALFRKTDSAAI